MKFLLSSLATVSTVFAQGQLVLDLNQQPGLASSSSPASFAAHANGVFFAATAPFVGRELWFVDHQGRASLAWDGVAGQQSSNPQHVTAFGAKIAFSAQDWQGTRRLHVFDPALGRIQVLSGANPSDLVAVGDKLFFFADSNGFGRELWVADVSSNRTERLSDMAPGAGSPVLAKITPFGNGVAMAVDDTIHGYEIWVSDGTSAGTRLVRDLRPGEASGTSGQRIVAAGGELFFAGDDGTTGAELYATDGQNVRLVADIQSGAANSYPGELVAFDNGVAFSATVGFARRLFYSDGTAGGTVELASGPDAGGEIVALADGRLAMVVNAGRVDLAFVAPGTHAFTLAGFDLGRATSYHLTAAGSTAYVVDARGDMFVSDGTSARTRALPAQVIGNFVGLADGSAYFGGFSSLHGIELWHTDGTVANTALAADIDPRRATADASPSAIAAIGGRALVVAESGQGLRLYASDGSVAGTRALAPMSRAARLVAELNDAVLIDDGTGSLWRSDGTTAGTGAIAQLQLDTSYYSLLFPYRDWRGELNGGRAVFVASNDGLQTSQLYVSDGTAAGTRLLVDLEPGQRIPSAGFARVRGGVCFVTHAVPAGSAQTTLWFSDGSASGTVALRTFPVPNILSGVIGTAGDRAIFLADDGVHGFEMWTTDGSIAGTQLLEDRTAGSGSTVFTNLRTASIGERLVLSIGSETVSTDGTPTSVVSLPAASRPVAVFAMGDLAIVARDTGAALDLVRTDGTAAGTQPLALTLPRGIVRGTLVSDRLLALNILLAGPPQQEFLFVTDGTAAGTRLLGTGDVQAPLLGVDGHLLYSASDSEHGIELWRVAVGATAQSQGFGCGDGLRLRVDAPRLGAQIEARVERGHAAHVLFLGHNRVVPLRLPLLDLSCASFVDSSAFVWLAMPGNGVLPISVPPGLELAGARLAAQAVSGPGTALPFDWSNGVRLTLGL
ncbi:MAG: hypothetical protein R3F56_06270 [Planctomycetota bacterium]